MLPTLGVIGNFLGLNTSLEQVIKNAVMGIGTVGTMVSAISNIANNRWLSFEDWEIESNKGLGFQGY
jgi:hypothetical protein